MSTELTALAVGIDSTVDFLLDHHMNRTSKLEARLSSSCAQYTPVASHFTPAAGADVTHKPPIDPILRLPEVLEIVRVGRTTLLKMVKTGTFPAPLNLTARIRGWRLSAVMEFLDSVEGK
ncbi:AlpA family phage regulatory protein [Paraburkholderia bannensis]|nr:AlpA family phage regulatory protein [Paraburkholderia bannensis]RQM49333.1 AlpA family phage regulatory protein [Paraburkholderia bannensis]